MRERAHSTFARSSTERVKRPKLRELASRLGIVAEYVNQGGRDVHTSDTTREALLAVMGFDAPSEDAARGWLDELEHEERELILEPVRVVERDDPTANRVRVRLPEGVSTADVRLTVTEEAGQVWHARQNIRRSDSLELPTRLPYGYHRLDAEVRSPSREIYSPPCSRPFHRRRSGSSSSRDSPSRAR